ncbi:sugar O-acetyltransferase [Enterococcus ureasiticus]|uniref:sugar O-acetyltransferase n=1 Tax=Enterococcus ureasiticus TaxID=903984 RepID=UPI001A8D4491|nr:sugar O-acetyltransferase [Enterococcus ureasiticus]MBO0473423.1 sugar O-acetyltransferase [Enterococcus ureasiticus]
MNMRERIIAGKLFLDGCEGLPEERKKAKKRMIAFNQTLPDELEERFQLLDEIFGSKVNAWIEPPFYFCYGYNIQLGEECYLNVGCTFIDDAKISIGNKVAFGPGVTIATVGHPIHPDYRRLMYGNPVTIEENCWIGANTTICPGVTIGKNSVIGAGSIVTKDIPKNSDAVGNPCKVIREISEEDRQFYYKDQPFLKEDLVEVYRLNDV